METCKSRNVKELAIAGGVASNSALRETIMNAASKKGIEVLFPAQYYVQIMQLWLEVQHTLI